MLDILLRIHGTCCFRNRKSFHTLLHICIEKHIMYLSCLFVPPPISPLSFIQPSVRPSICPSVSQHVRSRQPLNRISRNRSYSSGTMEFSVSMLSQNTFPYPARNTAIFVTPVALIRIPTFPSSFLPTNLTFCRSKHWFKFLQTALQS